jgi:sugar phosphate isomerase/epimerase
MRIGVLSKVFSRPSAEAVFDAVAAVGLECIQFNMESAGLAPMPDEIPTGLAERMREAAAERGLRIATVQGTFNMSHPDAEFRRAGLQRLRLIADACAPLGTAVIAICIGTRNRENMWGHHPDNETPEAWHDMTACVREAIRIAEGANVTLALEPEVTNIVDSAEKARRLLDEIGSPYLKVTMDGANLFHSGELPRMKEVLEHAFALVGRDIIVAHAKDLSRDGEAGHEAAGHGLLDYDRYLGLLRQYHFDGPLLLHGLSEAQVPGCVQFLREKLAGADSA